MLVPDSGNPAFGVLRAVVMDNNDPTTGPGASSYIDSDGLVGYALGRDISPATQAVIDDAKWHMVRCSKRFRTRFVFRQYALRITFATVWSGRPADHVCQRFGHLPCGKVPAPLQRLSCARRCRELLVIIRLGHRSASLWFRLPRLSAIFAFAAASDYSLDQHASHILGLAYLPVAGHGQHAWAGRPGLRVLCGWAAGWADTGDPDLHRCGICGRSSRSARSLFDSTIERGRNGRITIDQYRTTIDLSDIHALHTLDRLQK